MEDINRIKVVLAEKKRTNRWLAEELGTDPDKILRYYKWPQNFNCKNCALIDECCQFDLLRVVKNIQGKHQEANINHNTFIF